MKNTTYITTPPPELVQQWVDLLPQGSIKAFTAAVAWGADQELEACVQWLNSYMPGKTGDQLLRPFRRPKPPSLKELALQKLAWIEEENPGDQATFDTIRRALEALPDD
jgi:hypothetical protein